MNTEQRILDVLKETSLTNKEIARVTKLKINEVRQLTLKLKTLGKIKVERKVGVELVYTLNDNPSKNHLSANTLNDKYIDSLLFTFISNSTMVSYDQIVNFYSSLGIPENTVFFTLLRNLGRDLIEIQNLPEGLYPKIIQFCIDHYRDIENAYPLTMTFQDAFLFFKPIGLNSIETFIEDIKELSKKYPEFVSISSSKIGQPANLFTFNRIFIKPLKFATSGAWRVS